MQINRGVLLPACNSRGVDPNSQPRRGMSMNLRVLLIGVALALGAMATYAAETVTVYKDAT